MGLTREARPQAVLTHILIYTQDVLMDPHCRQAPLWRTFSRTWAFQLYNSGRHPWFLFSGAGVLGKRSTSTFAQSLPLSYKPQEVSLLSGDKAWLSPKVKHATCSGTWIHSSSIATLWMLPGLSIPKPHHCVAFAQKWWAYSVPYKPSSDIYSSLEITMQDVRLYNSKTSLI